MPKLSLLADEDQPVQFGQEGEALLPPTPQIGAPEGGEGPESPGVEAGEHGGPADFQQGMDPLAPPGYGEEPPALDDETLMEQEVTSDEAAQIAAMEEPLTRLLADDEEELPPDSPLLKPDDELIALFESRMQRAAAFRAPFEQRWLAAWLNYNQILTGAASSWNSHVFLPLVFQQVSAAIPPMVAAIYDSGPVWEARPTKPEHLDRAKAVTALLDWYMRDKTPSGRRLRDLLWYSTLFGTGFMRVTWKTTVGTQRAFKGVYGEPPQEGVRGDLLGTRMTVTPNQIVEDLPVLENIDIWDAFPAPNTRDDDYFPYFIEKVDLTIEDLQAMAESDFLGNEGPARVEEWLESKPENVVEENGLFSSAIKKSEAWRRVGMAPQSESANYGDEDADRSKSNVCVFVMWTNEYVLTISGDGTKILGKARNPYWFQKVPVVAHHFERIPGCIFGRGIGDIIEGLQAQANFNYNKGNDAVQLALNSPIAVRQAGNALVQGQVAWQPGAIIPCRDPSSDIKPLAVPDPMNAVFRLEDHLMLHADRATGINDISRGMSPEGANTATEFAGLQSQVRIRLSQHVREIRTTLGRIGSLLLRLAQQFVTQDLLIRVTGKRGLDFVPVTPEDVIQEYDLVPSANSVRSNPALLRSDVVALMEPMMASPLVKQDRWLKHVLRVFEVPDAEDMIQEPPPPPRDPRVEEQVLALGIDVEPSPDEDFQQHMIFHAQALQSTPPTGAAYAARKRHIEQTLLLQSQVMMASQGAMAPGAGGNPPAPPGGGGTEVRREASQNGNAHGAVGPGGGSPGPAAPPNRKNV